MSRLKWVAESFQGWFSLDSLNIQQQIGLKILKSFFAKVGINQPLALEQVHESIFDKQYLCNPSIVWELIGLREEIEL